MARAIVTRLPVGERQSAFRRSGSLVGRYRYGRSTKVFPMNSQRLHRELVLQLAGATHACTVDACGAPARCANSHVGHGFCDRSHR